MEDSALEGLRRHLARSFNDILVLRSLIRTPLWEYRLMSRIEETYGVKGGLPIIHPLLNNLESRVL